MSEILEAAWKAYIEYTGAREYDPGLYLSRYLELSPEYPLVMYRRGEETLILLSDFLWEGREALDAYRPGMSVTEVLDLFLENVGYRPETLEMLALDRPVETTEREDWEIRPLRPILDGPALAALKRACTKEERAAGSVSLRDVWPTGVYAEGRLVSAASAWLWGERLADLGVLTHGKYRRMGCGAAAVAAVAAVAQKEGRIPFYRCDGKNEASLSLAQSLGFTKIAQGEGAVVVYPE